MARGFGTTFGGGASERIVTAFTADTGSVHSWFLWTFRHGNGGSNNGVMFNQGDQNTKTGLYVYTDSSQQQRYSFYVPTWSAVYGKWQINTVLPSADVWHSIGISYDSSSTSNHPVRWIDSTKISGPTGILASPSGTYNSRAGNAYNIGADLVGAQNLYWDGKLAHMAIWDAILTDGEFLALASGVLPFKVRPASLVAYWPLDGLQSPEADLSGNANNGTLTGTRYADGPAVTMFMPKWPRNIDVSANYWQLYFSKNSGVYAPVTTTSLGVKSADASTDADETKILTPRL